MAPRAILGWLTSIVKYCWDSQALPLNLALPVPQCALPVVGATWTNASIRYPPCYAGCGVLLRQVSLFMRLLQAAQCRDHFFSARQSCSACIGAEFALAAEPHHDDAGEYAEYDFNDDCSDPECRAVAFFSSEDWRGRSCERSRATRKWPRYWRRLGSTPAWSCHRWLCFL